MRLGAIEPTASQRLPVLLMEFCQQRPKVHVTLEVGGTQAISQRVAAGDLDIGICTPPPAHLGLRFEQLFIEPLALLLPEHHPLAQRDALQVADLTEQRMLLTERGCTYRARIEAVLLSQNMNPYSGIEIGSIEAIKRVTQAGLGIAILPIASATPPPPHTVLRAISDVDVQVPVGLVYRNDASAWGRMLMTMLALLRAHLLEKQQEPPMEAQV